jgi:hypothetical protein
MLDYALHYARQGWPVLPLQPGGKVPLTAAGYKDASTDAGQITRWWEQWPTANVGFVTGTQSGVIVLDADVKNGVDGPAEVESLGIDQQTYKVDTPSGGYHLYFSAPTDVVVRRHIGIRPGVDILGEGGYVVAPGSVVGGATYLVANDAPIARCPAELLDLIRPDKRSRDTESRTRRVIAGGRNNYLTRVAGRLRRQGLERGELAQALQAVNSRRCDPPLGDAEVERIAESVSRYEASDPVEADPESWPEPQPIRAELSPVIPFVAEALLPPVLAAWVTDEADRMPCPPDFVAAAAMVALGSVIGTRCAVQPKSQDDWAVVPNIWGGLVGLPATKKSPAISAGLRPVNWLAARAVEAYEKERPTFEAEKLGLEAQVSALEAKVKAAAKKGSHSEVQSLAKELAYVKTLAAEEPVLRRYQTNDATVEKLGELLKSNTNGLLVQRDELVGLVASWDREGREGERAFFLEAWNGTGSFNTDRIGRGSIYIPNLCLSVLGGIQPDKLTGYLEAASHSLANDGMLQRFQMLVYPEHRPWAWRDRQPDAAARKRVLDLFEALSEFDPVTWGASPAEGASKYPCFRFGPEAQQVFIEWSECLHIRRIPNESSPIVVQHLAKFDKLFPSIALILHLVDCATSGQRGPISRAAAHAAAAWCEYLESHARRCYGLLVDGGFRAALTLAAKIRRGLLEDGFTARDVRRFQWRHLTTDQAVHAALDWLEGEDWLRAEETGGTGPGTGRRTVRYWINPRTLDDGDPSTANTDDRRLTAASAVRRRRDLREGPRSVDNDDDDDDRDEDGVSRRVERR